MLTTQMGSLCDMLLPTEATSSLYLQSAPIKLSALGGTGSLFHECFATWDTEHFPAILLQQAWRVFEIFQLSC